MLSATSVAMAKSDLSKETDWMKNLKCSDLVIPGTTDVNDKNIFPFAMWMRGYMAGISSSLRVNLTAHVKTGDFLAIVLSGCSKHPDEGAIETSVGVAEIMINLLDAKAPSAMKLNEPGDPATEE
jgi:hypothetical protein